MDSTWSLESTESSAWLSAVERNTWKHFGDIVKIRVGIKTTADSVFIRDDWESLTDISCPEQSLLLPLLTHRNVTAWSAPTRPATRVLYPYDLTARRRTVLELADYPRTGAYLNEFRERLEGRKYVIEGGRRWYEIWVPQKPAAWAQPKIVFPDISVDARFSIDRSGAVVNGDCYWIGFDQFADEDEAYLLVAIANSNTALKFYDILCGNKLYAGRRRWMTQYVNRLPLPDPSLPLSKRIIKLSRHICDEPLSTQTREKLIAESDALVEVALTKPAESNDP